MSIIIEGPDCSGKTTLATALAKKYQLEVEKCSPGEHAKTSNLSLDFFLNKLKENKIYDRFFISELVFSELYKRKSLLTFDEANKQIMKKIVSNNDIMIILFASDPSILCDRLDLKGEFDLYKDEIKAQNELYIKYAYVFQAWEYPNLYLIDINKYPLDVILYILGGN